MAKEHTSLIITSGTARTRNVDNLTVPCKDRPQAMTVHIRFVERNTPPWTRTLYLWIISDASFNTPAFFLHKTAGADTYTCNHSNGTVQRTSVVDVNPAWGDTIELTAQLAATGAVTLHGAKNGGAITSGAASAAAVLATSWSAPTLFRLDGTTAQPVIGYRDILRRRGILTMAEMRRIAGT